MAGTLVICSPATRHALQQNTSILMSKTCDIWQTGIHVEHSCCPPKCQMQHRYSSFPWQQHPPRGWFQHDGHLLRHHPQTWEGEEQTYLSPSNTWHYSILPVHPISWGYGTPTSKARSRAISICIAISATWTGWDPLRSKSFSQVLEPSFHWQLMNQPIVDLHWWVVPLTEILCWSSVRASPIHLTSTNSSFRTILIRVSLGCYAQLYFPINPYLWIFMPPVSLYFSASGSPCDPILLLSLLMYDSMYALCCFTHCFALHPHSHNFKIINTCLTQIWVYHGHTLLLQFHCLWEQSPHHQQIAKSTS